MTSLHEYSFNLWRHFMNIHFTYEDTSWIFTLSMTSLVNIHNHTSLMNIQDSWHHFMNIQDHAFNLWIFKTCHSWIFKIHDVTYEVTFSIWMFKNSWRVLMNIQNTPLHRSNLWKHFRILKLILEVLNYENVNHDYIYVWFLPVSLNKYSEIFCSMFLKEELLQTKTEHFLRHLKIKTILQASWS